MIQESILISGKNMASK